MYLDTVRGFAIFLVVFGHCIQFGNGRGFNCFGDPIFKVIYSFHMPLFALLSGYLFFVSMSKRAPRQLLVRQIGSLIVPALSWAIIFTCIGIFVGKFEHEDMYEIILKIYSSFRGYWFLWAMFWGAAGVLITEKLFAGRLYVYALEIFALLFVPGYIFSSLYIFVYPYFAAGYIWHRDGWDERFNLLPYRKKVMLGVCMIALWCIMLVFFRRGVYIYTTGTRILLLRARTFLPKQLIRDIYRWLIGFAGSASVMLILKSISPIKILALCGTSSLGIYIMSGYLMKCLPDVGGYIVNFLEAVIITFACCVLCWLIKKVKLLNKILLGGR